MKQGTLIIIMLLMTISASIAQLRQGTILAGGNFSVDIQNNKLKVDNTTTEFGKTTTISMNPGIGYFIVDGTAVGFNVLLTSFKFKSDDGDSELLTSVFTVGPFVKYYHESGLFGIGQVGFGSQQDESINGPVTVEVDRSAFEWRLGAGYAVFINKYVALEPSISYGGVRAKLKDVEPEQVEISNSFMINAGFTIFIH